MGPIGWAELVVFVFWIVIIAGVVWLVRRIRGISEDVAAIRRATPGEVAGAPSSNTALEELEELQTEGLITPDEYAAKRTEIISRL